MTDELNKAAVDASEALGMEVRCFPTWMRVQHHNMTQPEVVTVLVEVYDQLDGSSGEQPVVASDRPTAEALAYLEGLETGSRFMRGRYAEVVSAVHAMFSDMDAGYSPARGDCAVDRLAKALSELEG